MLLSNKQVRRRWSARAQGNHFALADGMEVGTIATLWDTQNRKYDKVSLLYMPANISSSVNMLFCFHCFCFNTGLFGASDKHNKRMAIYSDYNAINVDVCG